MSARGYRRVRDRWPVRAGEWAVHALVRTVRFLTWWVPVRPLGAALAPLGGLAALAVPGYRRRAEANIALVWPGMPAPARRRLVRAAGASFTRLGIEYVHLDRWARSVGIAVTGEERLAAAWGSGRGVLLVSAHYGNWEAIRLAVRAAGGNCAILYRAFNNRYLDRFGRTHIAPLGSPVLHKGRRGVRAMREHLAAGGTGLILVDQRNSGAPFLPFLGHPAETPTAAASLARATGAALMPAVARRSADGGRVSVVFEAPVEAAGAEAAMAEVNARIGAWIVADPGQWFWFHRRWRATHRSRPRGAATG